MHDYLEKTENAAEELFSIYEAVKDSWGDYALQEGLHKHLIKDLKGKLNNPKLTDTEKNDLNELLNTTELRLENYISETQIYDTAMRILAGSILQLAKQGLSTVFGAALNFPTEPQIAGIPVSKIIVAGRNQSLHHEEGYYNHNVYHSFQALEKINPNLSLHIFPEKNMSKDVIDILEWDNYESYLVTMKQIFKEASQNGRSAPMIEKVVRYISFPDIEGGVAGFYEFFSDGRCIEPSQSYHSGRCHTKGEELDKLAKQVGFKTRAEFSEQRKKEKFSSWKNAYGAELSQAIGKALEVQGITWNLNGSEILFRCPKDEFMLWPGKGSKYPL